MADRIDAVMATDVPTLRPDTPVRMAVAVLSDHDVSAAPVVDEAGALVGVLTQKDCFRSALNASYYQQWSGNVADFMTRQPATLEADTDLVAAAEAFLDRPYRCYPVTRDGQLVGMLRRGDLLRAFLQYG